MPNRTPQYCDDSDEGLAPYTSDAVPTPDRRMGLGHPRTSRRVRAVATMCAVVALVAAATVHVSPADPAGSSVAPPDCAVLSGSGWMGGLYRDVTVVTSGPLAWGAGLGWAPSLDSGSSQRFVASICLASPA